MSTHTFNPSVVRHRLKAVSAAVLSLVTVTAMASFWIWNSDAEGRALRQLPEQERRALYARTLETLESACNPATRAEGLDEFCYEQADFLTRFPECSAGACSGLVTRYGRVPSR